jgi:hypothetical protein
VLAYIFWHRPAEGTRSEDYERAQIAFQRSLARTPPYGFRGSAVFRIATLPWARRGEPRAKPRAKPVAQPAGAEPDALAGARYEDWYLVEDFAALGVLNEAAVGRGHRTSHDRAARSFGGGTAGIYRLLEGEISGPAQIAACAHATWVAPAAGTRAKHSELAAFLGDGLDQEGASLWQRQLLLGPAPEFCLLSREPPPGAAPTRLAANWSAATLARERVW